MEKKMYLSESDSVLGGGSVALYIALLFLMPRK